MHYIGSVRSLFGLKAESKHLCLLVSHTFVWPSLHTRVIAHQGHIKQVELNREDVAFPSFRKYKRRTMWNQLLQSYRLLWLFLPSVSAQTSLGVWGPHLHPKKGKILLWLLPVAILQWFLEFSSKVLNDGFAASPLCIGLQPTWGKSFISASRFRLWCKSTACTCSRREAPI